jgi:hypothetical protein
VGIPDGTVVGTLDGAPDGTVVGIPDGTVVGTLDGAPDGTVVGVFVGTVVGTLDGALEGTVVGTLDGAPEGTVVGVFVGTVVGTLDGAPDGTVVGVFVGTVVGTLDGALEGTVVGTLEGAPDGTRVGIPDGTVVGTLDGAPDGTVVGAFVGTVVGTLDGAPVGCPEGFPEGSLWELRTTALSKRLTRTCPCVKCPGTAVSCSNTLFCGAGSHKDGGDVGTTWRVGGVLVGIVSSSNNSTSVCRYDTPLLKHGSPPSYDCTFETVDAYMPRLTGSSGIPKLAASHVFVNTSTSTDNPTTIL